MDKLLNYDDKCFVRPGSLWRRELISRWTATPSGRSVAALSDGVVVGYGCRNAAVNGPEVHFVGPLYADSYNVARDLVHELTRDVTGQTIIIRIM